jgi:lysophospholipase L1-like esterase
VRGIFVLYAAALLIALVGCSSESDSPPVASSGGTEISVGPINVLALGDSYTVGEQVGKLESWPFQLVRSMRVAGRAVSEPTILAVSGWSTSDLIRGLQLTDLQTPFDVVTLQIGVNNQFRQGTIVDFEADLAELTKTSIDLVRGDAGRVILLSIPDWSVTPFADGAAKSEIADEIDNFNDVVHAQSEASGTHFIDITPISRLAANESDLIASDGLHPSAKMYAEWVELIQSVIEEIID